MAFVELPLHYGWFLNEEESKFISDTCWGYFPIALSNEKFKYAIKSNRPNPTHSLETFYNRDNFIDKSVLHCTSKFCGKGVAPGWKEYSHNKFVEDAVGKETTLHLHGFTFTPYSMGARLKLTNEQLVLWDNDDITAFYDTDEHKNVLEMMQTVFVPDYRPHFVDPLDKRKRHEEELSAFHPSCGKGCKSHISIGCAPGIWPVQTGFDQLALVDCEHEGTEPYHQEKLESGVIRYYDRPIPMAAFYLDEVLEIDAVFMVHF